jgi:protein-tyrosine phosphatase
MGTKLFWVPGPWTGRLALSARPRGGDWLEDEMKGWRLGGVDLLVSTLTPEEEREMDLEDEEKLARESGMEFVSLPIPDREIPPSRARLLQTVEELEESLSAGKNVSIHCRQGIGRTGLLASCLLIAEGISAEEAVRSLSLARGIPIPETEEQLHWIEDFAGRFAGAPAL